jgi:YD repeat-containing protein
MTLTQISPKKSQSRLGVKLVCTAVFLLPLQEIRACGDWSLPQNHFEGVNSTGFVDHWEQIGTLDLGDIKVPVNIGFQTYLPYVSKELGAGWILPLLDANIVQRDEGTFDMVQPDGWIALFRRDGSNPNILHGSGGMLAEIQGSTITVNSTCGSGWKMVFTQGKLTSLSKGKHTLSIERDALGRGVAIRDGITPVMRLEQDQATGLAKSIQIGSQKYQLGYDGKPRVETVQGQNMVGGVEPSLHEITFPDGKKETFDFAVTEKMLPSLKITDAEGKERMIVWGLDGRMLQDEEWSYKITPGSDPRGNASIGRTNPQKQMEYWFRDEEKGVETTVALDGTKTVKSWFTSGPAHGQVRKEELVSNGITKIIKQCSYDESGRLIRKMNTEGIATIFRYDDKGKRIGCSTDLNNPLLKIKEKELLENVETVDADGKNEAMKKLCYFYIHIIRLPDKAIPIADNITDNQMRYAILVQIAAYNYKLNAQQKILSYMNILKKYPQERSFLEESINKLKDNKKS